MPLFRTLPGAVTLLYHLACFVLSALLEWCSRRCCCCCCCCCYRQRGARPRQGAEKGTVAVVGGGIAGSGAAWALAADGYTVHIFEQASSLGGNAKTFDWPDGRRTGLSVLAWPSEYFHNYAALLSRLGIGHEKVDLGFHVRDPEGRDFRHGDPSSTLMQHHATGISRWQRMVRFVRSVNNVFNCFPPRKSLYDLNLLNPLNVMPLRWLSVLFGVSRECWDHLIVPVYASTFLTIELDMVPAIILPTISDIVPLERPASLRSWKANSSVVFAKMFPAEKDVSQPGRYHIHLNSPIRAADQDDATQLWSVETASGARHGGFDRIVFASSARNVYDCAGVLPARFRNLFTHIKYTQETDRSMHTGLIHSDPTTFFPKELIAAHSPYSILRDTANFIQVHRKADGSLAYSNTFVLSSWVPAVVHDGDAIPRLVTYDGLSNGKSEKGQEEKKGRADNVQRPKVALTYGAVQNDWNHPVLNPVSLVCQFLLRCVQGRNGVYFCGSLATPGNGHDLSFLSGLAVAQAIGAAFPFVDSALCTSDLAKLQALMGLQDESNN
jgi:hypothetical protein